MTRNHDKDEPNRSKTEKEDGDQVDQFVETSSPIEQDAPAATRETSSASGLSAGDADAGAERRRLYNEGATLVSRID